MTVALTTGVSAGHTILAAVSAGVSGAASCSDTKGNSYTIDVTAGGTGGVDSFLFVCRAIVTTPLLAGDSITVNYPSFTGASVVSVNEFAGIVSLDQALGATGNGTAPNSGSVSTTSANELLFAAIGWNGGASLTAGAGYSFTSPLVTGGSGVNRRNIRPQHRFVTSTGSYAGLGTLSSAADWRAAIVTYTVDNTAPTLTIVGAAPNPTAAGTTVTWTGSEVGTYQVRVGGSSCSTGTLVASGSYFPAGSTVDTAISSGQLSSGANTVRVCLTDGGQNVASQTTSITQDTTPPTVVIDNLAPNPTGTDSILTFHANENGTFSVRRGGGDCSGGTEIENGAYGSAPGTQQVTIPLGSIFEGNNTIRVCVSDALGNTGSITSNLIRDSSGPTVTIDGLSPNPTSGGANVTWHADENGNFSVRVGSTNCADGTEVSSGSYTVAPATTVSTLPPSSLAEGLNDIRVCLFDVVNNSGDSTTTVFKDSTPPAITIDSVSPNPTTGGTTVTWSANEGGTLRVRVGGTDCASGALIETGSYTANDTHVTVISSSELAEGSNTVRVCVIDPLINAGQRTVNVVKDTTTPTVDVVSVSPDPTSAGATVTWSGSENGTYSVRVGGADCTSGTQVDSGTYSTAPATRNFAIPAANLPEGLNVVRVCITDATLNVGSDTGSVTKDATAPTVTITSVSPNPTSGGTTITWNATENGPYVVRMGGTTCATGALIDSGTYSGAPTSQNTVATAAQVPNGTTTIRVCVTDSAGNQGQDTDTVVKDSNAPLVEIQCAPPTSEDGRVYWTANQAGNYTVRVAASDCTDGTVVASGSYPGVVPFVSTIPAANLDVGINNVVVCVINNLALSGFGQGLLTFRTPAAVDLDTDTPGRTFVGAASLSEFGSMAVGDVDGDGVADLVAAERPGRSAAGTVLRRTAGTAYGYLGGGSFLAGSTTSIPGTPAFRIIGGDVGDDLGVRTSANIEAGADVTGDGVGDIVISAPGADGLANGRLNAGEVYVLAGGAGLTGTIDLAGDTLPGVVAARIIGPSAGSALQIVSVADLDGDGIADLLMSAPTADPGGVTDAGEAFVLLGGASLTGTIDLATASTHAHFIGSEPGGTLGRDGEFGDISGTPDADVVLGAPGVSSSRGAAYAVFGPVGGEYTFGDLDEDVRWESDSASRLGLSVAIANVTGTPRRDVILSGRRMENGTGIATGGAVVFAAPIAFGIYTVDNPGTYGGASAVITGAADDDNFGAAFSHGDLDGDGYDELIIGAYRSDGASGTHPEAGSGWVVFGDACMAPNTDVAVETPAFVVHGRVDGAHLGRLHAGFGVGDLDDDGRNDFCLAATIRGNGELYCFSSPW